MTAVMLCLSCQDNEDNPSGPVPPMHEGHEYVDLGLPSGALWSTDELEVDGSRFFAWGETEPKVKYTSGTYELQDGADNTLTKYCTDENCGKDGFIDGIIELLPQDDPAHVHWGGKWSMPTNGELEELYEGCTWEAVQAENGVYSYVGTSKTNGKQIIVPTSGLIQNETVSYKDNGAFYWSSTLTVGDCMRVAGLSFSPQSINYKTGKRPMGHCVRPVIPGNRNVLLYVDLGLPSGVKWARHNVGAITPEEAGLYFSWGEVLPKPADKYDMTMQDSPYKFGGLKSITKYCTNPNHGTVDNKTILDLEDDAACQYLGEGWRMPTKAQIQELLDNCTWEFNPESVGHIVTGPNGNTIFLPCKGAKYQGAMEYEDERGFFWGCELDAVDGDWYANGLFIGKRSDVHMQGSKFARGSGRSIRGVYAGNEHNY